MSWPGQPPVKGYFKIPDTWYQTKNIVCRECILLPVCSERCPNFLVEFLKEEGNLYLVNICINNIKTWNESGRIE